MVNVNMAKNREIIIIILIILFFSLLFFFLSKKGSNAKNDKVKYNDALKEEFYLLQHEGNLEFLLVISYTVPRSTTTNIYKWICIHVHIINISTCTCKQSRTLWTPSFGYLSFSAN